MTKALVLPLVLPALVVGIAGCRGHNATGVFAVRKGMSEQQVRAVAGAPYRTDSKCWIYHAGKKGTSIDGMRFCFTNGLVSLIQIDLHG